MQKGMMLNQEIKNKYIEMVDRLQLENETTKTLKEFIQTYDGSNKPEFHNLMLEIIALLANVGVWEAEAGGFDDSENDGAEMSPFSIPVPTEA